MPGVPECVMPGKQPQRIGGNVFVNGERRIAAAEPTWQNPFTRSQNRVTPQSQYSGETCYSPTATQTFQSKSDCAEKHFSKTWANASFFSPTFLGRCAVLAWVGASFGTSASVPQLLRVSAQQDWPQVAVSELSGIDLPIFNIVARRSGPKMIAQTAVPGFTKLCQGLSSTELVSSQCLILGQSTYRQSIGVATGRGGVGPR